MDTTVKLTFEKKGQNYFGTAEVPTARGPLKFRCMVPMLDVRQQVRRYLAAQGSDVSGDPVIIGNLPVIEDRLAKLRAKRQLSTAIRMRFGGQVRPFEIPGPVGHSVRLAQHAANRADADVGSIFKKVGKGLKAVGKGIGKGTVAVGKGVGKGVKGVVKNPITGALLTQVPGGAAAMAIVASAKSGGQGAKDAINDINFLASQGDAQAIASRDALNAAGGKSPPWALIIGGAAALGGLGYFLTKKS